jgi:hypothetical protein
VLYIAVGQEGGGQSSGSNGGGGGGSWVMFGAADVPLAIAGGGGGTRTSVDQNGCDATAGEYGTTASGYATTHTCADRSDAPGEGGAASSVSWCSGGGGLSSDGGDDSSYGQGGSSWASGLVGGSSGSCGDAAEGGFGGGGQGRGCYGGGGGGGYSGGEGGRVAGGGGSYNLASDATSAGGVNDGHGYVLITLVGMGSGTDPGDGTDPGGTDTGGTDTGGSDTGDGPIELGTCGDRIVDPGEEYDPAPGPYSFITVDEETCRWDFGSVRQLYCNGACSWAGATDCDAADADILCKLLTDNPASTAITWTDTTALDEPGFPCGVLGYGDLIETDRGTGVDVYYQDSSISGDHGEGNVILDPVCTEPG